MFKIIEGDFKNNIYGNEEYLDNWPMLYLLENGKQIYIGESNHVKTRMTQHSSNIEKKIFDKVHFIYSKIFNQSVTFDYESKLIQYIVVFILNATSPSLTTNYKLTTNYLKTN